MTSVVNIKPATEAAFCKAERVTLVGSMIPAFKRSSYSSVLALNPILLLRSFTCLNYDTTFKTGIDGDLTQRLFKGLLYDLDAEFLVVGKFKIIEFFDAAQ